MGAQGYTNQNKWRQKAEDTSREESQWKIEDIWLEISVALVMHTVRCPLGDKMAEMEFTDSTRS